MRAATRSIQGETDKQAGLAFAETANAGFLEVMRRRAREIAIKQGSVTVDDLREYAFQQRIQPTRSSAWGAIFKGSEWQFLRFEPSRLRSNRGRVVRRWMLA